MHVFHPEAGFWKKSKDHRDDDSVRDFNKLPSVSVTMKLQHSFKARSVCDLPAGPWRRKSLWEGEGGEGRQTCQLSLVSVLGHESQEPGH